MSIQLDVSLRDRLVAGINRPELQRKLLSEKGTSFQNLRVVCETIEDLNNSTQEPAALFHVPSPSNQGQVTWFRKELESQDVQLVWRSAPPTGMQVSTDKRHIKNCRGITLILSSTAEREPDEPLTLMSFTGPISSNPSFDKPSCDPENLPRSSVLSGDNNEHCSIRASGYFTYLGT